MDLRLPTEERRAEILHATRQLIIESGPVGLSLRGVAKRCNLSAPGVLHHFGTWRALLEEVLEANYEDEAQAFLDATPPEPTLRQWADAIVSVLLARLDITRGFRALKTQALSDPAHPAHEFYLGKIDPYPQTLELAKRDYPGNPQAVAQILLVVSDGLQLQWMRDPAHIDHSHDWDQIADTLFAGFEQYRA